MRAFRAVAVVAGLAALLPVGSRAQLPTTFRSSTNIVPISATVLRKSGGYATGLKKDDFVITDNGRRQAIVSFSDEIQNISVSLILDMSGSMSETLPRVLDAADRFLANLLTEDRATVGTLHGTAPPFTKSKEDLQFSLSGLESDRDSPIWIALDRTMTSLAAEAGRRVIVIYTDGVNSEPPLTPAQKEKLKKSGLPQTPPVTYASVLSRVEREDLVIYAISFEGTTLEGGVRSLVSVSGGRAVDVKLDDDLSKIFGDVADELHHQYLLGFSPETLDDRVHVLDVRTRADGFKVRARERYVAIKSR